MVKGITLCVALFALGQILGWFQSNSILLGEWLQKNIILICLVLGQLTALCFAYGTKALYEVLPQVYAARFLGFAIGYLIFIPLTWYFFNESPLTMKNIISFLLCVVLISVQVFMK